MTEALKALSDNQDKLGNMEYALVRNPYRVIKASDLDDSIEIVFAMGMFDAGSAPEDALNYAISCGAL
jgi:hypothetical protein